MATSAHRPGPGSSQLQDRLLAGRYRLNRHIASGGMAEVWEATDQTLARRVAVKLLHHHLAHDATFVQRFRAEAIAAARLTHPSIVSVYDTFSEDGLEAIVMELVVGTTMRADLDQHGPMRLDALLAIGSQVADALGAAHASGLVHRDVKPANILLSADGRVLVADFGIAKAAAGSDMTSEGSMVGTAKYLAPEQVEGGRIDGRADLYSLGVVLYEALTGTPPFVADTDAGTAFARLHRDPVPPRQLRPEIPPLVEAVVLQAMSRRPEDRFATARALRAALLQAGADPSQASRAAVDAVANTSGPVPMVMPGQIDPPGPRNAPLLTSPPPAPAPQAPNPSPIPATPTGRPHAPVDPTPEPPAPHRRRGGIVVTLVVLLVLAAVGGFVVFGPSGQADAGPLGVRTARSFDPFDPDGIHEENEAQLPLAVDGDLTTTWSTEPYKNGDLTAGKGGVGLVLVLDGAHRLDRLQVDSALGGWNAEVYVHAGEPPTDLSGWGSPVASIQGADAEQHPVSLGGTRGDQILVWFTQLSADRTVEVREVEVIGR